MQPQELERFGWSYFDTWIAHFAKKASVLELKPEGGGYRMRDRFVRFYNLPELMAVFREVADIKTADMLDIPGLPAVRTGKAEIVSVEATPAQQAIMADFILRAEAIRTGRVKPEEDNMLKLTGEARLMAIDPRLIRPDADGTGSKLSVCIEDVYQVWKDTAASASTQLVFCDVGTPKAGKFNVYDEIRNVLLAKGVPESEICAFGGFRHQCCDPDFGKCRCCLSMKHTRQDLKIMQGWSLERKIRVTQTRIMEWYMRYDGQVFISFSGGKDSTVLLDLARRVYPDIPAVYVDTGLEYPELRDFVKTKDNVIWLRPRYPFTQILEKYGYPIISKEVSDVINGARKGQPYRLARLNGELLDKNGKKSIYNCENYKYLLDAPFKISARCCYHMKKAPLNKFERQSGRHPITGVLACESKLREQSWIKFGCNGFERQRPLSQPLAFWLEEDILRYLKMTGIPYAPIYGDIVESRKKNGTPILKTTGVSRSGCMYCMYGVHLEHEPNRFQLMQVTHPQQYDYCINKLGCGAVLDYIGVPYRNQQLEVDHC